MSRLVPPLNAVHVFEVVCRLGNFTHAANELGVTQSAVSRQISLLEHWLNTELFTRERLGVRLTKAGEEYSREICPAFQTIVSASGGLRRSGEKRPIFLQVYPTFAQRWLIPRLPSFNEEYPQFDVRVSTGIAPVDFSKGNVDLAIQLVPDDKIPKNSVTLFRDQMQPVCSRAYLEKMGPIAAIEDLAKHRLLVAHYRRADWKDWFAAVGHTDIDARTMEFQSSVLAYQAAAEGIGVAMGQTSLMGKDFEAGLLVPLFDPVERPLSYCAIWAPRTEPNQKSRAFLGWLSRIIKGRRGTRKT